MARWLWLPEPRAVKVGRTRCGWPRRVRTSSRWTSASRSPAFRMSNLLPVDLVEPEDVAAAVAWLVSDDARYITGVQLPVDAGFLNKL